MVLKEKLELIRKNVGKEYNMFFPDDSPFKGMYLGCFAPIYEVWPDALKYPLPTDDHAVNYIYGIQSIMRECRKVDYVDREAGDIITCMYGSELHVGILLNKNEVIHVLRGHKWQIDKVTSIFFRDKAKRFFRKNEV